ncbi:MAG TPA: hypothetical protein VJT79_12155 [Pseudonocardia sp.]|nr:hypothetical protein [Pseudonocardia sp.]
MHIDWASLLDIAIVAAAAALAVVLLVAFALVGLSTRTRQPTDGTDDVASADPRPALGVAAAVLCLLAAGLIVCYGLYLLVA